jgi:hypothetical protein
MKKPKTMQTAFRLPVELVKRLDRAALALEAECGVPISRADVVRKLLAEGTIAFAKAGESKAPFIKPEVRGR